MPDEDLLHAYLATSWRIRFGSETLVLRISTPSPLSNVGVITACNPRSVPRSRGENRVANRQLLDQLRHAGANVHFAVALGHGADAGIWREPGFAVSGLTLATLVELACAFGQNAVVWVSEAGIPRLVVTRDGFAGRSAGMPV